jgi:hypothetical protein
MGRVDKKNLARTSLIRSTPIGAQFGLTFSVNVPKGCLGTPPMVPSISKSTRNAVGSGSGVHPAPRTVSATKHLERATVCCSRNEECRTWIRDCLRVYIGLAHSGSAATTRPATTTTRPAGQSLGRLVFLGATPFDFLRRTASVCVEQ